LYGIFLIKCVPLWTLRHTKQVLATLVLLYVFSDGKNVILILQKNYQAVQYSNEFFTKKKWGMSPKRLLHDNAYLALLRSLAHKYLPVQLMSSTIGDINDAGNFANRNHAVFFLELFISHKSFHELHGVWFFGVGRIMNPELSKRRTISVVLFHINKVDDTEFELVKLDAYIFHSGH